MSLTYLLSTLPPLSFEGEAPMNLDVFLAFCKEQVIPGEHQLLWDLLYEPERVTHPILRKWTLWYRSLRHELVLFRAKDLSRNEVGHLSVEQMPYAPVHLAEESLHAINPLEGSKHLRHGEWEFLEALESTYYQHIVNLGVYALKLRILTRMGLYDQERGERRVEEYIASSLSDESMEAFWEEC